MARTEKNKLKALNSVRNNPEYLCHAPFVSMKISMDGRVSPCCYNKDMDDLYPVKNLQNIWEGEVFKSYRKQIKKNIFPAGCKTCENSFLNEEFESIKIPQYDVYRLNKKMPRMIELALENTCNLECIMCDGNHSSSIRKNIEKLPPVQSIFGNSFREEFKRFIPHLQEVVFAGGEPFLIKLYYDIWEDIIKINPDCEISLVTNGTVLNEKIKDILSRGKFKINLSFDAVSKEVYESIRVNARFETVKQNMKYFAEYLNQRSRRLHIPVCPLQINRFEIPDLVKFCNEENYSLNFVHVSGAFNSALWSLDSTELRYLKDFYNSCVFNISSDLHKQNYKAFLELIRKIDEWIVGAEKREDFRKQFDLGCNILPEIKKRFNSNVHSKLIMMYDDEETANLKKTEFDEKFGIIMNKLPDYFESNHFYLQLEKLSTSVIVVAVLNHSPEVMAEKCHELFFFPDRF